MKRLNKFFIIALAAAPLVVQSCHVAEDDLGDGPSGGVEFGVRMGSDLSVRSEGNMVTLPLVIDSGDAPVPAGLDTLSAYVYDSPIASPVTRGEPATEMYGSFLFAKGSDVHRAVRRGDSGAYPVVYRPEEWMRYVDVAGATSTRFYCWAPEEPEGFTVDPVGKTMTYSAPDSPYYSTDVVMAVSEDFDMYKEGYLDVTFRHILGALEVRTGTVFTAGNVTPVRLENVYMDGSYDMETGLWTVDPDSKGTVNLIDNIDMGQVLNTGAILDTPGHAISADENTYFLPPQVFPEGARIYLGVNLNGLQFFFTVDLSGLTLSAGRMMSVSFGTDEMFTFRGTGKPGATLTFRGQIQHYDGTGWTMPQGTVSTVVGDDGRFEILIPWMMSINPNDAATRDNIYTIDKMPVHIFSHDGQSFANFKNLKYINCPLDFAVLNSTRGMFEGCVSLLRAPEIRTANCVDMTNMFSGCTSLAEVPDYDTGNVRVFDGMFLNCKALVTAPELDMGSATSLGNMFKGCSSLTAVPDYDTPNVTNFHDMFNGCSRLAQAPDLDTSSGEQFYWMFARCSALTEAPDYDLGAARNLSSMFLDCANLTGTVSYDLPSATTVNGMFRGCKKIQGASFTGMDNCEDYSYLFYDCAKLASAEFPTTGAGTNFTSAFEGAAVLGSVTGLDCSSGENFFRMFKGARTLTSLDLVSTANGTNFGEMFDSADQLATVNGLDCSSGTDFNLMFSGTKVASVDLVSTANGTNFKRMFNSDTALSDLSLISGLDTRSGTDLSEMFKGCVNLVSFPPEGIDGTSATTINGMFKTCSSMVTAPVITGLSNCSDVAGLFAECSSLTTVPEYDLSAGVNFNGTFRVCSSLTAAPAWLTGDMTANGENFSRMFEESGITAAPAINLSKGTTFASMFKSCASLVTLPDYDTSSGTDFRAMFQGCVSMVTAPGLETANGTDFRELFNRCDALMNIPEYDFSSAAQVDSWFYGYGDENHLGGTLGGFRNIRISFHLGGNTSGRGITRESMLNIIARLHDFTADEGYDPDTFTPYVILIRQAVYDRLLQEDIDAAAAKGWSFTPES